LHLAIDIGNTRTKLGLFGPEGLQAQWVLPTDGLEADMAAVWPSLTAPLRVGWIQVATETDPRRWRGWPEGTEFLPIHTGMPLPIAHRYQTPATLGIDRIVGVIGALAIAGQGPVLVVDAGTAITYDVADAAGVYAGGGISPGLRMRFRALHTFTARLPLTEPVPTPELVGDSTETAIQAGVVLGLQAEVAGIIARYRARYGPGLRVFLTGGDLPYFENQVKSLTFADPDLILKGISHILTSSPS